MQHVCKQKWWESVPFILSFDIKWDHSVAAFNLWLIFKQVPKYLTSLIIYCYYHKVKK